MINHSVGLSLNTENENKHNINLRMDWHLLKLNPFTKRNIEMLEMFTYVFCLNEASAIKRLKSSFVFIALLHIRVTTIQLVFLAQSSLSHPHKKHVLLSSTTHFLGLIKLLGQLYTLKCIKGGGVRFGLTAVVFLKDDRCPAGTSIVHPNHQNHVSRRGEGREPGWEASFTVKLLKLSFLWFHKNGHRH